MEQFLKDYGLEWVGYENENLDDEDTSEYEEEEECADGIDTKSSRALERHMNVKTIFLYSYSVVKKNILI